MKTVTPLLFCLLIMLTACKKTDLVSTGNNTPDLPPSSSFENPIIGKWELGPFKILCWNVPDTTIYPNTIGNTIEFSKNDTAYYTYYSTNATGKSPFRVLSDSTFLLGYVQKIIFFDGRRLVTHCVTENNASQQWATYIRQ